MQEQLQNWAVGGSRRNSAGQDTESLYFLDQTVSRNINVEDIAAEGYEGREKHVTRQWGKSLITQWQKVQQIVSGSYEEFLRDEPDQIAKGTQFCC